MTSSTDAQLAVLRETVGTSVEKDIIEYDAVIDWRRDSSWNTLESILGLGSSSTSETVGIREALQQHAVLACIDVISRDMSKVDVDLYERLPGGGKRKVQPEEHWFAAMLAMDPNEEHTWAEFWQMATIHLVLVNNVYFAKDMTRRGDLSALIPIIPGRVMIRHDPLDWEKYFEISRGTLFEQAMLRNFGDYLRADQVIHIRKRIVDGLYGFSSLTAGGPTVSLAKSIDQYQKRLFNNDGQGRVAVEPDKDMKPLSPEAFDRMKREVRAAAKSMMSGGEAMLLEPGYSAKILAMTAADMRIAEMHDAQINSVARVFGVPPHKIAHVKDEKYSNLEVVERTYAHDVLIPIARAFETALARSLFSKQERLKYFVQFNREQMEVVDYKVRSEVLKIAAQSSALTIDEFRERLGLNPLPGGAGKVRLVQSTMALVEEGSNEVVIPAGSQAQQPAEVDQGDGNQADDKGLRVIAGGK